MENSRIRRKRRKQKMNLFVNLFFCVITLAALTGCIVLLLQKEALQREGQEAMARLAEYEQQEAQLYSRAELDALVEKAVNEGRDEQKGELLGELKKRMSAGSSTSEVLRDFYPEEVVVYADGRYQFFPISDTLNKHPYAYERFEKLDNGQIVYENESEDIVSKKGIDVSRYQGDISWSKVAADGVEYAFLRAGYRGSTEGRLMEDESFFDHMEGALANDIEVGVYFFTQALTEEEAVEEAEMVLEMIEPYEVTYPIVYDLEEVTGEEARTRELTKEQYTKNAVAFCERIREAGYTPMIYGNLKTFFIMLDLEQLEEYDKWFAYYNDSVYFPYDFSIWQYTSQGRVRGIGGDVDLNICMKDYGKGQE